MSTPTVISHMVMSDVGKEWGMGGEPIGAKNRSLACHNPMWALPIIVWGSKEPMHDQIAGMWEATKVIRDGDIEGLHNVNENRGMGAHY